MSSLLRSSAFTLPALTAAAAGLVAWGDGFQMARDLSLGVPLVLAGGAVSAAIALVTACDNHRLRARLAAPPEEAAPSPRTGGPDRAEEGRMARMRRLEREVEKLAAMRELSLIANDDTDFRQLMTRALPIVGELFEATEIQVFRCAEGEPRLDAIHKKRKTRFAEDGTRPLRGALKTALRALEESRGRTRLNSQRLTAVAVLRADLEPIGAIAVFVPTRGRGEAWAAEVLGELEELAKHIALLLSKPALYDRAVIDALTGLYSKRHFLEQAPRAMSAAARLDAPLSLIVIDIDRFKSINDSRGHVAGDHVLAEVGRRVRGSIRDYDSAFRFGGEEMCILAPNCELDAARGLAERIRLAIAEAPVDDASGPIKVTASFGLARYTAAMVGPDDLMAEADRWLYRAKQEGRDQVRPACGELSPSKATSSS